MQARELILNHGGQPLHQQTMSEGAVGDETELIVGEHDISSVSTISKASNFTDIDGA